MDAMDPQLAITLVDWRAFAFAKGRSSGLPKPRSQAGAWEREAGGTEFILARHRPYSQSVVLLKNRARIPRFLEETDRVHRTEPCLPWQIGECRDHSSSKMSPCRKAWRTSSDWFSSPS